MCIIILSPTSTLAIWWAQGLPDTELHNGVVASAGSTQAQLFKAEADPLVHLVHSLHNALCHSESTRPAAKTLPSNANKGVSSQVC